MRPKDRKICRWNLLQTLGDNLEEVCNPIRLSVIRRNPTANDDSAVSSHVSKLGFKGFASNVDPVDIDTVRRLFGKDLAGVISLV